ncbi:MAG TPA: WhiB family transcriptional regulator, partial [Candidatus Saccharimonadales bacterium]|nr:WhiB family transcriptional regulator [Candidatus Saccharimonadales bacterium]
AQGETATPLIDQTASHLQHPDIVATSDTQYSRCYGKTDLFFSKDKRDILRAKEICRLCMEKEVCLEGAISRKEEHGVWGAKEAREIRSIATRRRLVARGVIKEV